MTSNSISNTMQRSRTATESTNIPEVSVPAARGMGRPVLLCQASTMELVLGLFVYHLQVFYSVNKLSNQIL
jgi:hypothetical protein